MLSHLRRVVRAALKVDWTGVRWVSALRRGGVVIAVLITCYVTLGPAAAAHGASAAMLVGMFDKPGRSPRVTWHLMAVATLSFSVVTIIAGTFSSQPLVISMLMGALAFCAGVSWGVDARAPQVLVFCALQAAAFLVTPIEAASAPAAGLLVIACGGLQTICSWLASPVVSDRPERQAISAALEGVAGFLEAIAISAADDDSVMAHSRLSSAAMANAEDIVSRTDLPHGHRQNYAALLGSADALRLEARAWQARRHLGVAVPQDPATLRTFLAAAQCLVLASAAITRGAPDTAMEELDEMLARDLADRPGAPPSLTALAVVDLYAEIPDQAREIVSETEAHRSHRRIPTPLRQRLASSLSWGSTPLKHGSRMCAAALTGELVAHAVGLPHGSWVAATSMMLLRPDTGPTVPRILMRAGGTTVGTILVVIIAVLCGSNHVALIIATGIAVVVMYALIAVSYSFTVGLLAMTVLLLMSLDNLDTFDLAFARWVDVLVGCVIGTLYAVVFPLWKRTSLRSDAAKYADAVSAWFTEIAAFSQLEPGPARDAATPAAIAAGARCREQRLNVSSTLAVSLLEPPTAKEINPAIIGNVIAAIGKCSEGAIAASALLQHGHVSAATAAAEAEATAAAIAAIAESLRVGAYVGPVLTEDFERPPVPVGAAADRVTEVLAATVRNADAALLTASRMQQEGID